MKKNQIGHNSKTQNIQYQYQGFARGHPPYYWPGSNHLNFRDRTGSDALWLIWPNVMGHTYFVNIITMFIKVNFTHFVRLESIFKQSLRKYSSKYFDYQNSKWRLLIDIVNIMFLLEIIKERNDNNNILIMIRNEKESNRS